MAIIATSAVPALEQIHEINMRAVFGGSLFIFCCLIAVGLFSSSSKNIHYIFIVLTTVIALVSGVLLASALYVIQNPDIVTFWDITL